jgi:hypothetical protein
MDKENLFEPLYTDFASARNLVPMRSGLIPVVRRVTVESLYGGKGVAYKKCVEVCIERLCRFAG